jgi:hypothetical protein
MLYLDHVPVVCFAIKISIALPTASPSVIPATGVTSVYPRKPLRRGEVRNRLRVDVAMARAIVMAIANSFTIVDQRLYCLFVKRDD